MHLTSLMQPTQTDARLISNISTTKCKNMKTKIAFIILLLISCTSFLGFYESTNLNDESIKLYKETNVELDRIFKDLVEDIKKKHSSDPFVEEWVKQITQSQEAWKKFRDEEYKSAGYYWRGGGTGRAQTEWALRLTLQRIEDLKKRYDPR